MIRRGLIAIAVVLLLSACSRGATYHIPLPEVRRILLATGLPPFVFGTNDPAWKVQGDDDGVTWTIHQDGAEIFHYTAHLKPVDAGNTQVDVELVGNANAPTGNAAKGMADHPEIRDMYIVAIKERIASALEHRDFQIARVYPALGVATLENMGALRKSADAAAAASERMDRENIEKAYRDEAAGH
ncbi:MAG: hypothetical protein H0U98_00965 [Alphaproteobacteria bacterium]|nr:hypothetical protein [Alphaproteobacteria bacterium]